MKFLFKSYQDYVDMGAKVEDARFALPYSFYGNIIMGVDAHVLKNWIIRLTKGKESNVSELKELGDKLYKIMEEHVPYLKEMIDNFEIDNYDAVEKLLDEKIKDKDYEIIDKVNLLSYTPDTDKVITTSALMRVYGYSYDKALKMYEEIIDNEKLQREIMKESSKTVDKKELKQVNFCFQFPISFAVLTHFTRHRTHPILIPDFFPIKDLTKYKIPPSIEKMAKDKYINMFKKNVSVYKKFKEAGVCDEDLVYFYLAGNMLNITTNFDGGTFAHIMRLRICTKAQWETRELAFQMRDLVKKVAPIYGSILGSDCEIFRICKEGKESCGKLTALLESDKRLS
jgi:thymidylate synthase (FAD)